MKKISQPLHSLRRRVTATVATALLVGASTAYANNADITSLLQGSQPEQALKLIDQRLSATPKDPQLRFLQGVAFAMANKNKEAIDTFTQLTKEFPELPEPYNNLAVLYANQNQLDKSRQALEQAIRTNPSYSTAHENLGDIYAKLASQAYSKALQLDGSHAQSVQPKLALIHDLFSTGQAQAQAQALAQAPSAPAPVTATATQAVSSSTTAPAQATVVAAAATAQPVASAQPATATPVTETASPPATEPKAETKTTAKAEPKAETKAETKVETKAVATADAGQAAKADTPTAANVAEVEAPCTPGPKPGQPKTWPTTWPPTAPTSKPRANKAAKPGRQSAAPASSASAASA